MKINTIFIIALLIMIVSAFFTTKFPLRPEYAPFSSFFIVLLAVPCYYGMFRTFGLKKAIVMIAAMSIYALLLENVAIITGFPYGKFEYGILIGKTIVFVPWTVGFAWTPILFGAYAVTQKLFFSAPLLKKIFIITVLMVLLDFVLDPGSVRLGFWIWHTPGNFYGVPWLNFLGWCISSALAAVLFLSVFKDARKITPPSSWIFSSYFLSTVFWTAVAAFTGLWIPFTIGCVLCLFLYGVETV